MSALVSALSTVFWGLLLLSVLVSVHEAGHFLAARACGMRVTEFFLGIPCRLKLSRRSASRGTEVGVTPILLGGYTRICGMEAEPPACADRVLAAVAGLGRASVERIADEAGVSFDEALDALEVLSDWGSVEPYFDEAAGEKPGQRTWPAQFQTVRRDARLLTVYDKGHDFSLEGSTRAGEPHGLGGGAAKLLDAERSRTYLGKGFLQRIATLVAGPAVNVVLGIVIICAAIMAVGVTTVRDVPVIGQVEQGGLAQAAGLEAGDTVESLAGTQVDSWRSLASAIAQALGSGDPFDVVVERGGRRLTLTVTPAPDGSDTSLGVMATTEVMHPGPLVALRTAWSYFTMTGSYVLRLLQPAHTAEVVSQSSSVVGISVAARQAASAGLVSFCSLMAAVSLSLGLMNLLPILPLDGGKIVVELVQLVSRRRVSLRVQVGLSYAGLALVLCLFVIALVQDIFRLSIGG